ncbi:NupC/NupG family nucleoside CNT transporter [Halalkalibacter oceani]|uniref:NupC/NupG family nucleoside CNT transporter n=1 Tax=Halalkalibacter oceani TaxID=1653776 RepID=UPI003397C4DB
MNILWGLMGVVAVFAVAFALSANRRVIRLRTVLGGLAIQMLFALLILKTYWGQELLQGLTNMVQWVINSANEGIQFVFGGFFEEETGIEYVFAINVLSVVIFFSALISVLYYLGIMQWIIKIIGGGLSWLLGTSKTESMSAAANIFVGQTEAPLVVKPYLSKMTESELFAVMTGGLASVAGSVLIGYSLLGVPLEYLLAASFMAAPAGLIMAKMIVPEVAKTTDVDSEFTLTKDEESANVIDAAARGASTGLTLALNIGAMLLAFVALIALINGILAFVGGLFQFEQLSLELILGFLFAPLAFVIGVPWSEAVVAGGFIGQKLVLNEFVAYLSFSETIDQLSDKAVLVISFALCGFANLSSLGILLGGLGKLAPDRRPDIAKLGLRAVAAGMLASLLSAAIAGMMM